MSSTLPGVRLLVTGLAALDKLARRADHGVRDGQGVPLTFGTITVSVTFSPSTIRRSLEMLIEEEES